MELEVFLSKLDGVRHQPSGISARCPAHDDHDPSLSVNEGRDGGIVVKCHTGCATEDVMAALGLTMMDLAGAPHIAETYVYTDDAGTPVYKIDRWANPKDFRITPAGLPKSQRRLYRSDRLAWARERGETVYWPEGEKDADRLASLGLVSTTNPFGAGKYLPQYAHQVAGCHVVVIADNDPKGFAHARMVGRGIEDYASSVTLMHARVGNDVSDMLDFGLTLEGLDPLPEEDELASLIAANVVTKPITYAWSSYVPFGKVTMVEGDPGDGKSILSVDLTGRWTSGAPMPDGSTHGGPWPVVLISAEDDPEDTIVPRLMAAGADLNLVRLIEHGTQPDRAFNIFTDVPALARIVMDIGAKVVVVDPLMAMLGDKIDSFKDDSVRAGLYPLYRLARDTGAAVIVVRHLNKGSGGKAIYRGGGSIAFIGAARAAYTVGRDPEDHDRRVMACVKMNIAKEPPSLAYSILSGPKGPYLEWHGAVDASAQEIVDGTNYPKAAEIIRFLNAVVENGTPMAWTAIVARGRDEGYTEKQLRGHRGRSRLIKIVGDEGNRSAKWGYEEHLLSETHLTPLSPRTPNSPCPGGGVDGQVVSTYPPGGVQGQGKEAVYGESGGTWKDEEDSEDDRRDAELDSRPATCEVCGTEESVLKWAKPYWLVRCVNHSPLTYGAGS